jgi:hypothetical protein
MTHLFPSLILIIAITSLSLIEARVFWQVETTKPPPSARSTLLAMRDDLGREWQCINDILLFEKLNSRKDLLTLAVSKKISREIADCYKEPQPSYLWIYLAVPVAVIAFVIITFASCYESAVVYLMNPPRRDEEAAAEEP